MANKEAGEVELKVGAETYILCLTLGALAQIENAFEIDGLSEIGKVFNKPKADQFVGLIHALMLGGSEALTANPRQKGITKEDVMGMQIGLAPALKAIKDTFALTNMSDEPPVGEAAPGDADVTITPDPVLEAAAKTE